MWGGSGGWETSSERETGLDTGGSLEFGEDSGSAKIKDLGVKETTVLENLGDLHLIRERIDLQFLEKLGLGSVNLLTCGNNLLGSNNFDLTFNNLGLDLKILEERGELWIKTGGSSWDGYVTRSDHTWLGWGWSDLLIKNFLNFGKISVGEDNVSVSLKLIKDFLDIIVLGPVGTTSGSEIIFILGWSSIESGEGSFHEGLDKNGSLIKTRLIYLRSFP
jgi:hypothetical protein